MKAWAPFCFIMVPEIYFTINYTLNYYTQFVPMKLLLSYNINSVVSRLNARAVKNDLSTYKQLYIHYINTCT